MNRKVTLSTKERIHDKWIYVIIAMIVVGGIGYAWWFFDNHHKVESTLYSPTTTVLSNRYHTAQTLLKDAQTLQGEHGRTKLMNVFGDTALAHNEMVVIYDVTGSYKTHFDEMMNWVSQGGHLVIFNKEMLPHDWEDHRADSSVSDYKDYQNPLMLHLGVDYVAYEPNALKEVDKELSLAVTPIKMNDEMMVIQGSDYLGHEGRFLAEAFFARHPNAKLIAHDIYDEHHQLLPNIKTTLTPEQKIKINESLKKSPQIHDEPMLFHSGNALFDVMIDKGRLTILSEDQFFVNPISKIAGSTDDKQNAPVHTNHDWQLLTHQEEIAAHGYHGGLLWADNGEFLRALAGERHVYFVPDVESTGFFTLLWRHLMWSLIGMMALVAVSLLVLPKRFGAQAVYETDSSRNIFGFFGHVGQYLWASDGGQALFDQNRQTLIQTILAKEHMKDQSPTNIAKAVSEKTGLSYEVVFEALYGTWGQESDFVRISRSFAQVSQFYL